MRSRLAVSGRGRWIGIGDWIGIGLAAVPFLLRHARVTASTGMMEIESLASTASDNQDCTSKEKTQKAKGKGKRERQKGKAKGKGKRGENGICQASPAQHEDFELGE